MFDRSSRAFRCLAWITISVMLGAGATGSKVRDGIAEESARDVQSTVCQPEVQREVFVAPHTFVAKPFSSAEPRRLTDPWYELPARQEIQATHAWITARLPADHFRFTSLRPGLVGVVELRI